MGALLEGDFPEGGHKGRPYMNAIHQWDCDEVLEAVLAQERQALSDARLILDSQAV